MNSQAAACALLACGLLLPACTDKPVVRETLPAEARRILIISVGKSAVVPRLVTALKAGGMGSPPLPPITADVEWAETAAQATELVRKHTPLAPRYQAVYTNSITYARAAQLVDGQIPIVFEGVADPVSICVVDSVQSPGRNATGYMHFLPDDDAKLMELLHDGFPALRDVLMLVSAHNVGPASCEPAESYWTEPPPTDCVPGERALDPYIQRRLDGASLQAQARARGLRLRFVVACQESDFSALAHWGARQPQAGWLVPWHSLFDRNREALVKALGSSGRPAAYPNHGYARVGGLMSQAAVLDDGADRASWLALAQVLGGVRPAALPVQSPRGFSTIVNAKAATQMQLMPSLMVLRRADQILR